MKEDAIMNGQMKPGYNVQIETENRFVVSFSIHQKTNDMNVLIPHQEQVERRLGRLLRTVVADAGKSSEENHAGLEHAGIEVYVK